MAESTVYHRGAHSGLEDDDGDALLPYDNAKPAFAMDNGVTSTLRSAYSSFVTALLYIPSFVGC
ncbi:hypothetical protein SDRG_10044 [Saprolegnia diclina VS20]|uniref:Uncharacterized protein n=1 Tax=Saprolegnia diclina (strain VS20) TaxID=1156394 RepID=T0RQF5_SAPDV|nr:hypothetical protein SDRG_10044 [Saprolegnia diclina VS20]EQC32297.1 hypothetical protein SDRG_10044 [Saprolegnia diclina VS20]|eukprot:XP_008614238.1 hypothetical protein SDRG_10044 [Saprolegnia diclina VS20]